MGSNSPSFTVRIPFELAPGRYLNNEQPSEFDLLGAKSTIAIEDGQYVLIASDLLSEEAAQIFVQKAGVALIWCGLTQRIGIRYQNEITPINIATEPLPIAKDSPFSEIVKFAGWSDFHGDYTTNKTVVVPEHKRLFAFTGGKPTFRNEIPVQTFAKSIQDGIAEIGSTALAPKLQLACEVYLSSFFENSPAASFLSRITTLEILADAPASDRVRQKVEKFIEETKASLHTEKSEAGQQDYQSLIGSLAYLRNRSIKGGIRSLFKEVFSGELGINPATELGREVAKLYDLRSDMVHRGVTDHDLVQTAANRLAEITPKLLLLLLKGSSYRP